MDNRLYSFVFKGLLTEEALDKAGRKNKSLYSSEEERMLSSKLSLSELDEDFVKSAKKMSIVYTAICALENTVRSFISKKLLEEKGANWWEECVSDKIRSKAESRKLEENKIRWHTPRGDAFINYTEFGDLVSILNQNWNYFEPHLVSLEWASQIIKSLERSRNVIMHSGELANEDIERIGTYIRDWIRQVGA